MNINFLNQNNIANVGRMNQGINRKPNQIPESMGAQSNHKDSLSISPMGRALTAIDTLMQQKEELNERKNELIGSTLEQGGDIKSIEVQLKSYETQLKTIDDQIDEVMSQEFIDKDKLVESKKESQPKTKEEQEKEKIATLTAMTTDIEHIETLASVKGKIERELSTIKSSMKLDGTPLKSTIARAEDLQDRISKVDSTIGKSLASLSDKISETNKPNTIVEEDDKEELVENVEHEEVQMLYLKEKSQYAI